MKDTKKFSINVSTAREFLVKKYKRAESEPSRLASPLLKQSLTNIIKCLQMFQASDGTFHNIRILMPPKNTFY